jgi:integrase
MPTNDHTTSEGNLGTKKQDRRRAYYEANKELCLARSKAYYEANKDKQKEYAKQYYLANKAKMRDRYVANKDEINAHRKTYREANQDRIKAYRDNNREKLNAKERTRYRRQYDLTDAEYSKMIAACKGRCPCCKSPFTTMFGTCATPCIDHWHEIGKTKKGIRGIICNRCNLLLGYAHDSVKILRACANYLEQKRAKLSS